MALSDAAQEALDRIRAAYVKAEHPHHRRWTIKPANKAERAAFQELRAQGYIKEVTFGGDWGLTEDGIQRLFRHDAQGSGAITIHAANSTFGAIAMGSNARAKHTSSPSREKRDIEETMTTSHSPSIFISHAATDADIGKALIALIQGALVITEDDAIRCTSVPGYGLPVGANAVSALKNDIAGCKAFIALLTTTSLDSAFVLMELGAAWAHDKPALLCLAPWVRFSELPGPFAQIHAIQWNQDANMANLIHEISKATGFKERRPDRIVTAVSEFIGSVRMTAPTTS